jgi:A/G-specific adenine glycosylase
MAFMNLEIDKIKKDIFIITLLQWFEANSRNFPWRIETDPYKILVSEMMLQKTRAENVIPVYNKFIKKYPNIKSLHMASFEDLKEEIKLLGLSTQRAKKFKLLGVVLVDKYNEKIPCNKGDLLELPGVGLYIANAVACFAFGADVPLLDTNIGRIIERVFSIKVSGEERKKIKVWNTIADFIPANKAREFNYSLIDFGAIVCTSRSPKHNLCPLIKICDYASNIKILSKNL